MQTENGQIILYFHGANEGKKYELIKKTIAPVLKWIAHIT